MARTTMAMYGMWLLFIALCVFPHPTLSQTTLTASPTEVEPGSTQALKLTCSATPSSIIGAYTGLAIYFTPDTGSPTIRSHKSLKSQSEKDQDDAVITLGVAVETLPPIVINPFAVAATTKKPSTNPKQIVLNPVQQTLPPIVLNPFAVAATTKNPGTTLPSIVLNPFAVTATPKPAVTFPFTNSTGTPQPTHTTKFTQRTTTTIKSTTSQSSTTTVPSNISNQPQAMSTIKPITTINPTTNTATSNNKPQPAQRVELAHVSNMAPNPVPNSMQQGLNFTAAGHIGTQNAVSTLTLTVNQPSMKHVGKYECVINGVYKNYTQFNSSEITKVGKKNVITNPVQVGNEITKLRNDVDWLKKRWHKIDNSPIFYHSEMSGSHKKRFVLSRRQVQNVDLCQFICQVMGGHLAEIKNKKEFDFVRNFTDTFLRRENDFAGVFLGATDRGHRGTWTFFTDSKSKPYLAWGASSSGGYDCLGLTKDADFFMNDFECAGSNRFLCEVPI